jgi:hypothetical protein
MNEQIQKLYDQADKFAKENRTQTISGPGNNYFELFHEKFAQLIVKECMNLVTYVGHSTRGFDCCGHVRFTNEKIKEHFGVEE